MLEARVLSVQSHVVHGYVGNKSAVFPLQLLGYDVDIINTVQFSNHTGYKKFGGTKMTPTEFNDLYNALLQNDLLRTTTHLLQGYCPSADLLRNIHKTSLVMKEQNPSFCYLCDPVMGDHGKLYVSEELVTVYRDVVVPSAQFVIPNQFEAELLTGIKINCEEDAIKACNCLHDKGVEVVVITSLYYYKDEIVLMGSSRKQNSRCCFTLKMPKLPHYYTGTGDLFGALLLGWSIKHPDDLKKVCEKAVAGIRAVILNTAAYQETLNASDSRKNHPELRIIQSRQEIEHPIVSLYGEYLSHE